MNNSKQQPETPSALAPSVPDPSDASSLLANLRVVILESRRHVQLAVDVIQVRTCWIVGRHIVEFELAGQTRAAYGKGVLAQVSAQLTAEFGKGFDERNLRNMRAFYVTFPIWNALRTELSWTHYRLLSRVDSATAREWYMNEAATQNWNTRALERQIGTLYYERLLSSKDRQPVIDEAAQNLAEIQASPRDFIRDPVMLEFLGLPGTGKLLESKGKAKAFTRTYDFLATILPYGVQDWEKLSIYLNFLISKLPAPIEQDLAKGILEAIDMDSYRAEKKVTLAIALPDANAEIEPVPTSGGGRKPEPELDRFSNIVRAFNDQFGGLFADGKRMEQRIKGEIPKGVAADEKYQNAMKNSDRQAARIEHDKALRRVITALFKDAAQLFKQFQDNESFRAWLTDTMFEMTYDAA